METTNMQKTPYKNPIIFTFQGNASSNYPAKDVELLDAINSIGRECLFKSALPTISYREILNYFLGHKMDMCKILIRTEKYCDKVKEGDKKIIVLTNRDISGCVYQQPLEAIAVKQGDFFAFEYEIKFTLNCFTSIVTDLFYDWHIRIYPL